MAQWSLANVAAWAVQAAVLVAAGVWLPSRLRLGSPGLRVALFRVLLIACLALPLAQPWRPSSSPAPSADASVVSLAAPAAGGEAGSVAVLPGRASAGASAVTRARDWLAGLPWAGAVLFVLALGILARLAWLALGLVSLARIRRRSIPLDPIPPSVRDAERAVGTAAEFREARRVARPVTFGLRRPVVLVPPGFARLEPAQQLAVACHELLHVRRQDWLRVLGDEVIRAFVWFHPVVWWLVEQIHLSTEQMIDRRVVGLIGDRRSYLRALLALAVTDAGPRLQPAACFLDHGHLRQRVALLMEEASMSGIRLGVSVAAVVTVVAAGGWWSVSAFPLRAAPDPSPASAASASRQAQATRPGVPTAKSGGQADEATLQKRIQASPKDPANYFALARLYEKAGRLEKAGATLEAAVDAAPGDRVAYMQVVGFYNRHGDFDKAAQWMDRWTTAHPADPVAHYTSAAYYWEKAYKDESLTGARKRAYVDRGLQEADAAIALNGDYMEALIYKSLLLRLQARDAADPAVRKALVAEAEQLRSRADEIRDAREAAGLPIATYAAPKVAHGAGTPALVPPPPPAPPPPPPPPAMKRAPGEVVGGVAGGVSAPVRVGGNIPPPAKIKDVKPVYPEDAQQGRVQGTVIVEATIDEAGRVIDAHVLRSVPLLDEAALDAVRQWEFEPTRLGGKPVPVVMTVTVKFTLHP